MGLKQTALIGRGRVQLKERTEKTSRGHSSEEKKKSYTIVATSSYATENPSPDLSRREPTAKTRGGKVGMRGGSVVKND